MVCVHSGAVEYQIFPFCSSYVGFANKDLSHASWKNAVNIPKMERINYTLQSDCKNAVLYKNELSFKSQHSFVLKFLRHWKLENVILVICEDRMMIILLLLIWIQLIGVNLVFNENKQYVLDKIKEGYC